MKLLAAQRQQQLQQLLKPLQLLLAAANCIATVVLGQQRRHISAAGGVARLPLLGNRVRFVFVLLCCFFVPMGCDYTKMSALPPHSPV